MNTTIVGIDLAKLVFQVHGVDARGKVGLRKQLERYQIVAFFCTDGAVPHWDGSMRRGAFLGAQAHGTRAHRQTDRTVTVGLPGCGHVDRATF
jgi:hypothetical protein